MYFKSLYKKLDEEMIVEEVRKEGFDPTTFSNSPGFVYHPHKHLETKLLVFLEGSMEVQVADKTYQCTPGDKLIVPGNTKHSAIVGKDGCTFLWSEKIITK